MKVNCSLGAGKVYFRKVLDELTVVGGTPLIFSITSYDSYFLSSSLSLSLSLLFIYFLFYGGRGGGGRGNGLVRVFYAPENHPLPFRQSEYLFEGSQMVLFDLCIPKLC